MIKNKSTQMLLLVLSFMFIFFYGVINLSFISDKAYAASTVWAEKSKVEYGDSIKIHYNFDDRGHAVKINIYFNGSLIDQKYNFNTSTSNTLTFSSYTDEGTVRVEVIPLDATNYSGEAVVKVYKHRVVLIPGIMASELYDGSNKVWIPKPSPNVKRDIEKMAMNSSGGEIVNLSAGSPEAQYYKTLHDYLDKKFHVIDFGYDWRFGATVNANLLKNKVNNAKATSPDSNIYLVAHSMGGIIATEYINLGYGRNIDKLVTIGTPYLGAPKAAYIFETGNASGITYQDVIINSSIRKIMPNILSAYELLPSKKYFSLNTTSYLSQNIFLGPSLNITRKSPYKTVKFSNFESTKSFLKSRNWANDTLITKAQNFHDNLDIINNLNTVDSYYIVGDKIATIGGMTVYDTYDQPIRDIKTIQGDGTVPVISASVGKNLVTSKTYYIQEEHTKLPGNVNVQKQVENILLGNASQLAPNVRKFNETTKTLKLKIESPVDLNVYDNSGNHLGYSAAGELEENIPFASFYTDGETKIALLNDGDYNVKLQGTGHGDMIYSLIWSNEQDEEIRTVRFDEIAVTPNTIFTSGTNANGEIELRIDENGDGNIDSTIAPSVDLNATGTQDEIKPTISSTMLGVKGVNEWYGKDAAYKLTGKDDESGIYKVFYSLDDSEFKEYTDPIELPETGIYKFKSFARDKNRNDSDVLEETIKVDTTNPTNPKMVVEPLKWTNKFVSITLSDAEDKDSGFQTYQYKIGESSEWINYKEPVIISNEGLHKVFARTLDNVFNPSEVVSGEAKVDKTPPSKPKGFKTLIRDFNQLKISWENSTDNVEVVGYDVYLNSNYVTTLKDTEYTFNNLTRDTPYTIKIVARDEAENSSEEGLYYDSTPSNLISSSSYHTIRIKPDGSVWSWGNNTNGQLGDGTTTNKTTAVQVEGLSDVVNVAAADKHSLVLKRDGSVWAWGYNENGQLGTGDTKASRIPVQIPGLEGVVEIAAGTDASYALKRDGTVWSWGSNNRGQLGDGTVVSPRLTPVQVKGVNGVNALAAGDGFAYALKGDGTVWGWGSTSHKQLGNRAEEQKVWKAEMITGLNNIKSIGAGLTSGLALTKNGELYRWGMTSEIVSTPTKWQDDVKTMSAGNQNIQVVKNDGSLWVMGYNKNGELGLGTTQSAATLVQNKNMSDVMATVGGNSSTLAIKSDGSVWSWGINDKGQLGDGTVTNRTVPVKVLDNQPPQIKLLYPVGSQSTPEQVSKISRPSILWNHTDVALTVFAAYQVQILNETDQVIVDTGAVNQAVTTATNFWTVDQELPVGVPLKVQVRVKDESLWSDWSEAGWMTIGEESNTGTTEAQISTRTFHSIYVKPDGSVWSWGNNTNGQLGDGTTTNKTTAVQVEGLSDVVNVAAADKHSLVLKRDGSVWAWGYNENGQLGTGDTKASRIPVQIPGLEGVVEIAAGTDASYALKRDGTVWSWGSNNRGQLGDGTVVSPRLTPVQVKGVNGVNALAAGDGFAYALKGDGTVWGWGSTSHKQLGNRAEEQKVWKAEMITGLNNIKSIGAGLTSGLALTKNGELYRWGMTSEIVSTPTKWQDDVKTMSAGDQNIQVVKNDGSLWVMGYNKNGELGLGTTQSAATLVQNKNMSDVMATVGGNSSTLAIKSDGSVWSWGINDKGQLGDGTVTNRTVPVKVLDNQPPQIKLLYPVGSQSTPEQVSKISRPSILWNHTDVALTVFAAYQVQILNETDQVIVDTGAVNQAVTTATNFWTVDQELPVGVPLKVQVRVKDESLWSDWSEAGWMTIGEESNTGTIEAQISTRTFHSIYVKPDGSVWSWGNNTNGQLGDGTTTNKTTAVQVEGLSDVVNVAAADKHSLVLKRDGSVWAWGYNENGQLGTGDTKASRIPVQIPGLEGVVEIAAGTDASYALKRDGTVWSWGSNNRGQLGDGTVVSPRLTPVQVKGVNGVNALAAGDGFAYALKGDGTVWGWGSTSHKQLGNRAEEQKVWKAEMITGLNNIKSIGAGLTSGLALTKNGELYRWGMTSEIVLTPTKWQDDVKTMSAGNQNIQVVKNDGSLWVMGYNKNGELGLGTTQSAATLVQNKNMSDVMATVGGNSSTLAIKSDGSVWSWGINDKGQLGDGTVTNRTVPVKVLDNQPPQIKLLYPVGSQSTPEQVSKISRPSILWNHTDVALTVFAAYQVQILNETDQVIVDTGAVNQAVTTATNFWTVDQELPVGVPLKVQVRVKDESLWSDWSEAGWMTIGEESNTGTIEAQISTRTFHSIYVKPDGSVWSWGNNTNGQLGDGTTTNKTTAVQVEGLSDVVNVAAADKHSLVLKRDGSVWAWGYNENGQLGTGDTKASRIPVQIPGLEGVVEIAAGTDASYALKRDGTVWSWGSNNRGQLGDGTVVSPRLTPVQVKGVNGVNALAAGDGFAYALKGDGTVWGWGSTSHKQLGNRAEEQKVWKAEMITGLNNIKSIGAGLTSGLALTKNGELYRWGMTSEIVLTPTKWQDDVKTMSAGNQNIQVVKNDGSLWVMGYNKNGELGLGTTQSAATLVQNKNMSDVMATVGGNSSTLAIKSDGSVWSWGINDKGQLGDGTVTNRTAPVKVVGLDNPTLSSMKVTPSYFTIDLGKEKNDGNNFVEGDVTVTVSVYGLGGMQVDSLTETKTLKITNYSDESKSGDGYVSQSLLQDISFNEGIATFSLTLDKEGLYEYEFELEGFEQKQKVTLNVESKNEEAGNVLSFVTLPSNQATSGVDFGTQPVLRILNSNGEPVSEAAITAEIASEVKGSLIGIVQLVSDSEGYIRFENLGAVIEESEGEIFINFRVDGSDYFISSPTIKISSHVNPIGIDSISSKVNKTTRLK